MLPALAAVASASSLLYFMTPRMPLYKVITIRIVTIAITSYYSLQLSATLKAGFQIDNENFVGADVHAALVDIYYPDWNGHLVHIGKLTETDVDTEIVEEEEEESASNDVCFDNEVAKSVCQENNNKCKAECVINESSSSSSSALEENNNRSKPFFTVKPRKTSYTHDEVIQISLDKVGPNVYVKALWDAIYNRGMIEVPTSGVAHLKTSLSPQISLGVTCYNFVKLFPPPLSIEMRNCAVEGISTGWSDIEGRGGKLREEAMKRFQESGIIFGKGQRYTPEQFDYEIIKEEENAMLGEKAGKIPEPIIEWHTF